MKALARAGALISKGNALYSPKKSRPKAARKGGKQGGVKQSGQEPLAIQTILDVLFINAKD